MTDFLEKNELAAFERGEFLDFVVSIFQVNTENEIEHNGWVRHFNMLSPHPAKSDLIYWPAEDADNSPEGVVVEIERYCRENGLPCFKDSDF